MEKVDATIRQSAFFYLELELPIIPLCPPDHEGVGEKHYRQCKSPGKAPVIPNWSRRGVPTEKEVTEWFSMKPESPQYNIGMVLGDTGHYNLVGVDVDGEAGEKLLEEVSQGVLPETWEFRTANGRRLIYELPEGVESKKSAQKGEDGELALLAAGQQTVMPPSIHPSGITYEWTSSPTDVDLAEAPQWILNLILVQDAPGQHEKTVNLDDWNKKVTKGERNNHLTKLAGSLIARRNIPKQQIMAFLKTWNEQNCDPPLPIIEIETMVENLHEVELSKQASRKAKGKDKEALRPIAFAEHFVAQQKKANIEWKYCVDRGVFYRCDTLTGPWEIVDNIYLNKEIRKALVAKDMGWDSQRHVQETVHAMRELLADPANDELFDIGLNPDVNHVYVANGRLDWRNTELKPWTPNTYCTIKLPGKWDPDAEQTHEYKEWEKVLRSWVPDEETRNFLQEYVGYCLIPDCSHRMAVFLYGPGSNGKSLFLDVISGLFKGYISFVPLHWIGERFESAKLMDKLINVCGDIDNKYMTETSMLKSMIAGDPVRAEFKHGKSFHFHPVCRLMFSANQLPKASDKSEGWYSRWKFIEFPRRFKTDTKFKRNLMLTMSSEAGLSALLHWSVEGLRRLYRTEEFTQSGSMVEAERQYRLENDTVQAFFGQALRKVGHTGSETQVSIPSLYQTYRNWCEDYGVKAVSQHEFSRRLGALDIERGVRQIKHVSVNCFLGVVFSEEGKELGYDKEYMFHESIRLSTIKRKSKTKEA